MDRRILDHYNTASLAGSALPRSPSTLRTLTKLLVHPSVEDQAFVCERLVVLYTPVPGAVEPEHLKRARSFPKVSGRVGRIRDWQSHREKGDWHDVRDDFVSKLPSPKSFNNLLTRKSLPTAQKVIHEPESDVFWHIRDH